MNKHHKNTPGVSLFQITLSLTLLSISAVLLAAASFDRDATSGNGSREGSSPIQVIESYHNDVSVRVRELPAMWPPVVKGEEREANFNPKIPIHHEDSPDPVVQNRFWTDLLEPYIPSPILNFAGIPYPGVGCFCAPPDTNGAVGQTQYVQIVNEGFQVFNKSTGASVLGPVAISSLWSGFGGVCESNGSGDPVVVYDKIANRWVISQFAGSSVPTDECVAVSTTSDATGSYYRYGFHLGTNFFDYPKLGVWPDAYYISMNVFNSSGTAYLGPQPFAFDRARMLVGQPATVITPGITGGSGEETYLPADLDGSTLPPAGAPNSFMEWPSGSPLVHKIFHFHVDFATPANSSFTLFATPAAAGFTQLCPATRSCVPQLGTTSGLDGLADRLMFRLAYRNFGDHESVVTNYTVNSGGVAAVRWIELRNVTNGPVSVYQQSTYQPDTTWRWMGSAAMDRMGNLALGFSASSSSINPQIRYAGRLASDSLNSLAQGEATLYAGTGSQTGTANRWGDYSALTVDPVDDCTFWYTNEYYDSTSSFNWRTRIGTFKFPSCGSSPSPTPTPTATPTPRPTPTPAPSSTPTPTPAPTSTPTPTPAPRPTPTPTSTPAPTATPTPTPPLITVTASVSVTPSQIGFGQTATFTVSVAPGPVSQSVTVSYSMSGNAVQGSDYTLSGTPGQVTISAGQSSGTAVLTSRKTSNARRNATLNLTSCGPNCVVTSSNQNSATVILK